MHNGGRPRLSVRAELTSDAVKVLRAIRDEIDAECVFRGTDTHAAQLAGLDVVETRAALRLLAKRRLIVLERTA